MVSTVPRLEPFSTSVSLHPKVGRDPNDSGHRTVEACMLRNLKPIRENRTFSAKCKESADLSGGPPSSTGIQWFQWRERVAQIPWIIDPNLLFIRLTDLLAYAELAFHLLGSWCGAYPLLSYKPSENCCLPFKVQRMKRQRGNGFSIPTFKSFKGRAVQPVTPSS